MWQIPADILCYLFLVNAISDKGSQALAESLKQNKTLTKLNLQSVSGLGRLLLDLYDKTQLIASTILSLGNSIGSEGVHALAEYLK